MYNEHKIKKKNIGYHVYLFKMAISVLMGVGWGNYAYTTILKYLKCTLFVIKLNFTKQNKTFLPFFFYYFCKKYKMLAPWNGSHRKKRFRVPGFRRI